MRERITPEDTFFDKETCEELGIEYNDDPYEEDFIPEDEVIKIIEKEHELACRFLNTYESSWWKTLEGEEDPPYIRFHQEEKQKRRM